MTGRRPRGAVVLLLQGHRASLLLVGPAKKNPLSLNLKEPARRVPVSPFPRRFWFRSPDGVTGGVRWLCHMALREEAPRNLLPEPVRLGELRLCSGLCFPAGGRTPSRLGMEIFILEWRLIKSVSPARPSGGAQAVLYPVLVHALVLQWARGAGEGRVLGRNMANQAATGCWDAVPALLCV